MGSALQTWQLVEAPPVVPLPFGLFSVVEPRLSLDEHWRLGVRWQSQACVESKTTTGQCIEPREAPLDPDNLCAVLEYDPFTAYAYNDDSLIGYSLEEHQQHAVDRLLAGEQRAAETHLWGLLGAAVPVPTSLVGWDITYGLGWVEQALAEAYPGTGVLHMNRAAATMLWDRLRQSGTRLTTTLGTPVVVGAGYDPLPVAPDGLGIIYGTGPLALYRGDIDTREAAVDRSNNTASYIAQRDYVIGWDCTAIGAAVTLATAPTP